MVHRGFGLVGKLPSSTLICCNAAIPEPINIIEQISKILKLGDWYIHLFREGFNEKKTFSFGHCPNYLNTPPPWPRFGQLDPLFSEVEIQDLKVSLELRILYILYDIRYICNLKKQLKVQYIGIFEEIDSFYWPKMHF